MANQTSPPNRPIKLLMLHGFTQSGPLFHAKTRALEKNLQKAFPSGISLIYPTAPIRLLPADIPFPLPPSKDTSPENQDNSEIDCWAWWKRKDSGEGGGEQQYVYDGIETGFAHIASILKTEGPFDGVIGFSQGGAMTGMVASLLEPGRRAAFETLYEKGGMKFPESFINNEGEIIHPQLKFAVSYSGFAPRGIEAYKAFYEPKLSTPFLHVLGSLDATVEEKRSLALVEACENTEGRVVYHPGGHFVPASQKAYVSALIGFIKDVLHSAEGEEKKEENVEDMDVPF